MQFWCDKYLPKTFDELDYQLERAKSIKTIVANSSFPPLLFFGPSNSGKKTRIRCVLNTLYGNAVQSLHIDNYEYETPSKIINIKTFNSKFHIEIDFWY